PLPWLRHAPDRRFGHCATAQVHADPRTGTLYAVQGLLTGSRLSVQAQPSGGAQANRNLGERSAIDLVAWGALKESRVSAGRIVTEKQIEFGKRLGLDWTGKSIDVANAMIVDEVQRQFYGKNDIGVATSKQIELAKKFNFDIANETRRVADAVITDIMLKLNQEAIAQQKLKP